VQLGSGEFVQVAAILLLVAVLGCLRFAYRHYRDVKSDFEPWTAAELPRHPASTGTRALEEVSFQSSGGSPLAGWYVPSRNGAAIVVTHGTGADRSSMVAEMRILSDAGFGVLAFDWPGHGASAGTPRWDAGERRALISAVDWLASRPDVDFTRLGGLGFSMGGYVMAQAAASDPRLRAVILLSAPTDYAELTRWQHRRWGIFGQFPALLAMHNSRMPVAERRPVDVVHEIAPRALFVIGGDADQTVPPFMARALFDAARDPKLLWMIPGATHGGHVSAAGDTYGSRVVAFFQTSLQPGCSPRA
jgi:dipeptidyl aminopeptidase/acylaminoacyl peptidase